ncbi:MAG: hypothetical protein ACRDLO_13530 [Solirubrobacterales bacterium]
MANISFFYPERRKGLALGLNIAGGNRGVPVAQLVVPLAIIVGVPAAAVALPPTSQVREWFQEAILKCGTASTSRSGDHRSE